MTYLSNIVTFYHFIACILKVRVSLGRTDAVVGFPGVVSCISPIIFQIDVDGQSVIY